MFNLKFTPLPTKYICVDQQYGKSGLIFHIFLLDLDKLKITMISHEDYAMTVVEVLNRYRDSYQSVIFDTSVQIRQLILLDLESRYDLDISHTCPSREEIALMKNHRLTLYGMYKMMGYKEVNFKNDL